METTVPGVATGRGAAEPIGKVRAARVENSGRSADRHQE
jgi:hypothetical protein